MEARHASLGRRTLEEIIQKRAAARLNHISPKLQSLMEQNTLPSLTKALKDVALEKDAAVVAREDLSTQLRTLKKRLKENSTRTIQS